MLARMGAPPGEKCDRGYPVLPEPCGMPESALSGQEKRLSGRDLPASVTRVFGDLRGRLDAELQAISYAQDNAICTVEEGGVLRHWDCASGRQIQWVALSELETCWAFSPDGKLLASGSDHLSIWDVEVGALLGRLSEPAWMLTLAFSPDGKTVATGHDDCIVRLWNLQDGKLLHTLVCHENSVCALAFSADGSRLATAGEDRLVVLWDVDTGSIEQRLLGHTDRIDALAWNATGSRIASAGWDTSARVWDTASGELLCMLNGQGDCVHAVTFSPDGGLLVCGDSDNVVRLWDYQQLKMVAELRRHQAPVKRIAMRPDGRQIATGGSDRSIQIWDLPACEPVIADDCPVTQVRGISLSDDGALLAVHAEGRQACWEVLTGAPLAPPESGSFVALSVCGPDKKRAVATVEGKISVVTEAGKVACWQAHEQVVRSLAFRPDGAQLASSAGTDGTVKLWDPAAGEPMLIIPEATQKCTIESIAYHPLQPWLAVAGVDWLGSRETDGVVAIWDCQTHQIKHLLEGGATRVTFSPDGMLLAAISLYESIVVWDVGAGTLMRELGGQESAINAIAFDRSGAHLLCGGEDGSLRIWNCQNWKQAAAIELHTCIHDLAITADGAGVVTGNGNSTCYLIGLEGLLSSD